MKLAEIDFETRSRTPIKAGPSRYSLDAEALCMGYTIFDDEYAPLPEHSFLWEPGQPIPENLVEVIESGGLVYAFNVWFEMSVWRNIMVPKFGFPAIPATSWRCSQAEVRALSLPAGLDQAAKALGVPEDKDTEGHKLMMKMTKPRKPTKHNKAEWHDGPDLRARLGQYCKQDTRTAAVLRQASKRLCPRELQVFHYDAVVNLRGIHIDRELAESAVQLWDQHTERRNADLAKITGGKVSSYTEIKGITEFLKNEGVDMASMDKAHVSAYLAQNISPAAKEVLTIRQELGLASIAKYKAMLLSIEPDDRIRGCHQYHGASTGRFAGRLIQPQNFPRGVLKEEQIDEMVPVVKRRDLDLFDMVSEQLLGDVLSSMVRSTICAPKGRKLIVCDFAAVEARGLAWMAGESWMLDAFHNKKDLYKLMASDIYKVPADTVTKDQRFYGKTAVLGCFGGDTRVLTKRGYRKIVEITPEDKLWDGVEWVRSDGNIYQGLKWTVHALGVSATRDHKVLYGGRWCNWETVVQKILKDKFDKESWTCPYERTYDILNCGPRNRFTIWTTDGDMVVHNCGYQMGAARFQAQLEQVGVESNFEQCDAIVKAYRAKNRNIVNFWYRVQDAAVACVKSGLRQKAGPFYFHKDGDFLFVRMPAGRDIAYFKPTISAGTYGDQVSFLGVDTRGKLAKETTYGGKLVENLCQALCRDVLIDAMSRLERKGYTVHMHVHDEVVCEVDEDFGSLEEVEEIMCQVPSWAEGFPVGAEGFETKRYKK